MGRFLQSREKLLAAVLIVVFFLLNLSIASRSPWGGKMDEVAYIDAGLNLAAGRGWTTTDDSWETDREFFAGGSPLYPGGLAAWSRIFGISIVSSRAYGYFISACAMSFLWLGAYRLNLFTPGFRLLWIIMLSNEHAMNWMTRDGRYDVCIYFAMAVAFFGASLRVPLARYAVVFAGGFLVPLAGFVGMPYTLLVAGLTCLVTKFRLWRESFAACAGAGVGMVSVFLFYQVCGSLAAFRTGIAMRSGGGVIHYQHVWNVFQYPTIDWGVAAMIGVMILLSIYYLVYPAPGVLPWVQFAWGMIILLPCVMMLRGVFVLMYIYLLVVPLSVAVFQLITRALDRPLGKPLRVISLLAIGIMCLGLPLRLYVTYKDWGFRDPQNEQDFVRKYIHPDDHVYAADHFYFQLRDYVQFSAFFFYRTAVPPDEAARINVALIDDRDTKDLAQNPGELGKLGINGWEKIAVFPTPEMLTKFKNPPPHLTYTLYRREVPSP